jgi:GT2 family glycosyltransferase
VHRKQRLTVTIIIVTLNRPDCVRRCLECLGSQSTTPGQVIVVDSSPDNRTQRVVEAFNSVLYLHNENGYSKMTASRNIGLKAATGDIIAFLDDDAYAHDDWLANLLSTYEQNPDAGAVGGRALNNQPDEAKIGVDRIGRLTPSGLLEGWFAADPGKVIEVDHLMGCNMSFRREVLAKLGGFREDYPGISGVREDSDMCLRVARAGYKILLNPKAVVTHVGAPQAKGRRFDTRYAYYASRNHAMLMARNFGIWRAIVWRSAVRELVENCSETAWRLVAAIARFGARLLGLIIGTAAGLRFALVERHDPRRRDEKGRALSIGLQRESEQQIPPPLGATAGGTIPALAPSDAAVSSAKVGTFVADTLS